ncbi:hypothetical protein KUTeg_011390 [Tegillarca granosa]|uniref:Menin n=1 Tax=Tegillarca granosa TaxID=220873 RepID=A0ABQ9F3C7_TEGGR|nr:hypothetical protein KUTeg_011390 [Tegillarca granosa]
MAGFREREKQYFPLQKIQDVVDLFKDQLTTPDEPNLALLSIVLGLIENTLTVNRALPNHIDSSQSLEPIFPVVELSIVEALYTKFVTQIKRSVDLTKFPDGNATRELVKFVSDVVWSSLMRSYYKDKAHLQSLYSYLTGNKLDCFGVAFAVVAAFQVLEYKDVHLALSEDHAWVVFGEDLKDSAEVTWHEPVICTRQMEVASIVSGINPSINATTDSVEMASLQQDLLWLLHDLGHLEKYPMALGNLGDLEEISPTPGRPPPLDLFEESIEANKKYYNNRHVYPYTYLGAYQYRNMNYKEALQAWADAASVVKTYNYNRQDEEIYKEFLEIANDLIPQMMKSVASDNAARIHHTSILYNPDCYSNFLRFYDGICEWEEDSPNPVLHITWANQLAFSLSKFDCSVRKLIALPGTGESSSSSEEDSEEDEEDEVNHNKDNKKDDKENITQTDDNKIEKVVKARGRRRKKGKTGKEVHVNNNSEESLEHDDRGEKKSSEIDSRKMNGKNEEQIKSVIEELVSKVGDEGQTETPNPNIAALAQACSESILNPEYLLGGGEPFTTSASTSTTTVTTSTSDSKVDFNEFLSSKSNGSPFMGMTVDSMLKAESPADMMIFRKQPSSTRTPTPVSEEGNIDSNNDSVTQVIVENNSPLPEFESVELNLRSEKMRGLRKYFLRQK